MMAFSLTELRRVGNMGVITAYKYLEMVFI